MARTVNPIKKLLIKQSLLKGNTAKQALKDANYAKTTARRSTMNKSIKICQAEIAQEMAMSNEELKDKLRALIKLRLELNLQVFEEAKNIKNKKERLQVLHKTKDNIAELTKTLRLVEGDTTENIKVTEAERVERYNNLREFMRAS